MRPSIEDWDCSSLSQARSSLGVMLTRLLNSLGHWLDGIGGGEGRQMYSMTVFLSFAILAVFLCLIVYAENGYKLTGLGLYKKSVLVESCLVDVMDSPEMEMMTVCISDRSVIELSYTLFCHYIKM